MDCCSLMTSQTKNRFYHGDSLTDTLLQSEYTRAVAHLFWPQQNSFQHAPALFRTQPPLRKWKSALCRRLLSFFFHKRDVSPAGFVKHFSRRNFIFLPSVWLYTVAAVFCSLFSSIVPQCARCASLYEAPLTSLHQRDTEFLPPWSACERIWHATQTLTLRRGNAGGFVPRVPFLSLFSYKCKFCVWALEQVCMCPLGLRQLLETYRGVFLFVYFFLYSTDY